MKVRMLAFYTLSLLVCSIYASEEKDNTLKELSKFTKVTAKWVCEFNKIHPEINNKAMGQALSTLNPALTTDSKKYVATQEFRERLATAFATIYRAEYPKDPLSVNDRELSRQARRITADLLRDLYPPRPQYIARGSGYHTEF